MRLTTTLLFLTAMATSRAWAQAPDSSRYIIYLHAKIVESGGRHPTDPQFGPYEYDAILDSLGAAGFTVLSDQRPPNANSDSAARRVVAQVDSLLALGVPPDRITVIGFSKGGYIALLASAWLDQPKVSFVFMAACGPWSYDRKDVHVTGRLLSLRETSDSLGLTCAPMFARRGAGTRFREIAVSLGLGHGTFFVPRDAWLRPALAWARQLDP